MKNITVQELKQKIDNNENIQLIDVRSAIDHASGHIKGSKNIPLDVINNHAEELKSATYEKTYLYCNTGNQSGQAYESLNSLGVDNIVNVHGGIQEWERLGYELIATKKTISIMRQVQIVAGLLIMTGVALSFLVHEYFVFLSGFVGLGLFYAGVSNNCTMAKILGKMPWNKIDTCNCNNTGNKTCSC